MYEPLQVNHPDLDNVQIYTVNGHHIIRFCLAYDENHHDYVDYHRERDAEQRYVNAVSHLLFGKCETLVTFNLGEPLIMYRLYNIVDHRDYIMNKLFEIADDLKGDSNG